MALASYREENIGIMFTPYNTVYTHSYIKWYNIWYNAALYIENYIKHLQTLFVTCNDIDIGVYSILFPSLG